MSEGVEKGGEDREGGVKSSSEKGEGRGGENEGGPWSGQGEGFLAVTLSANNKDPIQTS